MAAILQSLGRTIIAGIVLLVLLVLIANNVTGEAQQFGHAWSAFVMRWLHVVSGIMWIGLLWYFNFVQIPSMPKSRMSKSLPLVKLLPQPRCFGFAGPHWRL